MFGRNIFMQAIIRFYNIGLLTGCNRITILGKRKENDNLINVQNNVDLENHVNCV